MTARLGRGGSANLLAPTAHKFMIKLNLLRQPYGLTTAERQEIGRRRKISLETNTPDKKAWREPPWPSPSHGSGECNWCGGELRDPERDHCDVDEGCYWQWCVNEMERRIHAGLPTIPGGEVYKYV